jgi:DMSO/TMAO reductase YedYZ molybdopterin-dependent catalytic subunit
VKLSVLLQEAGVDPKANWILAEGADASGMSRSIPVAKAMDDALIALYQNAANACGLQMAIRCGSCCRDTKAT